METDEEMIYTLNSIIEKKDKEIKELNRMLDSERFAVIQINAIGESIKKDCFHQKYKRCFAMAKICENKLGTVVKPGWWDKWRNRWLELAEYFKERNTNDKIMEDISDWEKEAAKKIFEPSEKNQR